jgi:hypothetical protein
MLTLANKPRNKIGFKRTSSERDSPLFRSSREHSETTPKSMQADELVAGPEPDVTTPSNEW